MSMIEYGGTKKQIEIQKKCKHEWYGPCRDSISRYNKCKKCYCFERDCKDQKDFERLVKESEEYN